MALMEKSITPLSELLDWGKCGILKSVSICIRSLLSALQLLLLLLSAMFFHMQHTKQ